MSTYGFIEVIDTNNNSHLVQVDMIIDIKSKIINKNQDMIYYLSFQNPTLDFEIDSENYKLIKEVVEVINVYSNWSYYHCTPSSSGS